MWKNRHILDIAVSTMVAALALLPMCGTAAMEQQRLDLDSFLEIVRERHPFFESQRLAVEIETLARDGTLGAEDWMLKASARTARNHQLASVLSPERVDSHSAGITAERVFWRTGGRFLTGWRFAYARPEFALPDPFSIPTFGSYGNEYFVEYSHPLLRNAGGIIDRTPYDSSVLSVEMAALQAEEDEEAFLLNLAKRFVEWASLGEQFGITLDRLELAQTQHDRVKEKHRNFLVDEIDVLRAADAVRAAEAQARLVQSRRDAAAAELAVLAQRAELSLWQPSFDLQSLLPAPKAEEAMRELHRPVRILRVLDLRRQIAKREYRALLSEKKPDLSLNIGVSRTGGGTNERDLFNLNRQGFSVGLEFSVPLGNRAAAAKAKQGAARVRRIELQAEQTALELEASLHELLVQLAKLGEVLAIDDLQIASARAKTAEEIEYYNQGRSDLTFVIQAQDAEQDAKLTRVRNATSYHLLSLQLSALLDHFPSGLAGRSRFDSGSRS